MMMLFAGVLDIHPFTSVLARPRQERLLAMAQVQFLMEIITNNSVKFRAPNNELLELENEVRDLSRVIRAERQRVLDY